MTDGEEGGLGLLLDDELVDDHELQSPQHDAFGHTDFVQELVGLVLRAPTPANVALFGAWGSGKSGVARLLARELEEYDAGAVRFACFDASKYAEAPLRRHFISRVATELGIESRRFHDGLYVAENVDRVRFGKRQWATVLGRLLVPLLMVAAALAGFAGLFSWIGDDSFVEALLKVVAVAAPTTVLLGVIVKVAADGFTVTRSRSVPSGDEELRRASARWSRKRRPSD